MSMCKPIYPFRTLEEMALWLIKFDLIDDRSWFDSDAYDGNATVASLSHAWREARDIQSMELGKEYRELTRKQEKRRT